MAFFSSFILLIAFRFILQPFWPGVSSDRLSAAQYECHGRYSMSPTWQQVHWRWKNRRHFGVNWQRRAIDYGRHWFRDIWSHFNWRFGDRELVFATDRRSRRRSTDTHRSLSRRFEAADSDFPRRTSVYRSSWISWHRWLRLLGSWQSHSIIHELCRYVSFWELDFSLFTGSPKRH